MTKHQQLLIFAFSVAALFTAFAPHMGWALERDNNDKPTFVYLTTDLKASQSSISFGCDDKIHVVAYFKNGLSDKDYNLKAIWRGPTGEIFHRTSRDYPNIDKNPNSAKNALWLWLKIDQSVYDKAMDPSSIMGSNPLSGSWSVELYINDNMVAELKFLLNC